MCVNLKVAHLSQILLFCYVVVLCLMAYVCCMHAYPYMYRKTYDIIGVMNEGFKRLGS